MWIPCGYGYLRRDHMSEGGNSLKIYIFFFVEKQPLLKINDYVNGYFELFGSFSLGLGEYSVRGWLIDLILNIIFWVFYGVFI